MVDSNGANGRISLRQASQRRALGTLRNECLNENEFSALEEARGIIEAWRYDYNAYRSDAALGNKTPEELILGLVHQQLSPLSAA